MYADFWDWLHYHPIWILSLFISYAYYLASTEEVKHY